MKISTPSSPIWMCGLNLSGTNTSSRNKGAYEAGVNSSSQSSTPITVSSVATTASPNGTVVYPMSVWTRYRNIHITYLPSDLPYDARKRVFLGLPVFRPRGKVSQLPLRPSAISTHPSGRTHIIAIIRHPHLWPDEENFAVVDDHSAIVRDVLVQDRPVVVNS